MKTGPEFTCAICGAPMKLKEKLPTITKPTVQYRRRKFKCSVCDFEEVIYANGKVDKNTKGAIEDINKIYKQEEENRND
jgi:transcription initiation factor IIE alpha subunit